MERGDLLQELGKRADAEGAYREALKIQTQLVHDFPGVPAYRQQLASSHHNLGVLFHGTRKLAEAEAAYREALKIQEQLMQDFLGDRKYHHEAAKSYHHLAILLTHRGKGDDAEAAYRQAMKIEAQLARDFPSVKVHSHELAETMGNLALLLAERKQLEPARRLLEDAEPHHQAALRADPHNPVYQQLYRNNRGNLADILVQQGDHTAAMEAAGELIQAAVDPKNDFYNAACLMARCVPLADRDNRLLESQQKEKARTYADCALATLRQAVQYGFQDARRMKKDAALHALRSSPEFQKLLRDMEPKTKAEGE
jgi:tetratricopeptide (TPR) repeat protein